MRNRRSFAQSIPWAHHVGVNGAQTSNTATNSGAAYVFVRLGTNWVQQAYLKASNAEKEDNFGIGIAIEADTIVVGASGEDSAARGLNGNENDNAATDSGAAYIFKRSGTNWVQQAYLKASNTATNARFGARVTISGGTIVVGATGEQSGASGVNGDQSDRSVPGSGAAYVFVEDGTNGVQQAYLKSSNPMLYANFGLPPAISGDTLVVAAPNEASSGRGVNGTQNNDRSSGSGAAYVFVRNGTNWTQQAYLKASNADMNDAFGSAVTISGDTVVVGARGEDSGSPTDPVYAWGLNNKGQIVGRSDIHAVIWSYDGTPLDLATRLDQSGAGWSLREAKGINDFGQIVGYGQYDLDGNGVIQPITRGFLLTPIPALSVALTAGSLTLSWSTNFPGFVPSHNTDLNQSTWLPLPNSPRQINDHHVVTLTPSSSQNQFFRLEWLAK